MKADFISEYMPVGYYYDGLKLWAIYPIPNLYSREFLGKKIKQRYWKGSVEGLFEGKKTEFKSHHKMISKEEAEDRFPEYFI